MKDLFVKLWPLFLKLAPIVLAAVTTNNVKQLLSGEVLDALQQIIYIALPALGIPVTAGAALYVDSQEKKAALNTTPPAQAEVEKDLQFFRLDLPDGKVAVSLHTSAPAALVAKAKELLAFAVGGAK